MNQLQKIQRDIETLVGKRSLATAAQRPKLTTRIAKLRAERDLLLIAGR